jgi:hypothetical protein
MIVKNILIHMHKTGTTPMLGNYNSESIFCSQIRMQVSTTTIITIDDLGNQCTLSLIMCITLIGPITLVMLIDLKH